MICPICGSLNLIKGEKYGEFTLNTCKDCGVIFWDPLKHPGKNFYETSELHRIEGIKKLQWRHKQFLKNPPVTGGNFLDIGCGTGEFINEVRSLGFDVWGIDISSKQVEFAKKDYNLKNVYNETLEEFSKNKNLLKFDAISFFEVLEHLPNPKEFIGQVKNLLAAGGYIIFSVPNTDRIGMGKESEETPPNHLFRWEKDSISKFLNQEGFEILKIIEQPFSKEFFFTTGFFSFGMVDKLKNRPSSIKKKVTETGIYNRRLVVVSFLAKIKNVLLLPIAHILALVPRILGYKYWDLYVVAKLK